MSVPWVGTNLRYRPWPAPLGVVPTAALMVKQVRLQGLVVGSRRQQQDMVCAINAHAFQARHRQQIQSRAARHRLPLPRGGQTFREDMRRVLTMRAFSQ